MDEIIFFKACILWTFSRDSYLSLVYFDWENSHTGGQKVTMSWVMLMSGLLFITSVCMYKSTRCPRHGLFTACDAWWLHKSVDSLNSLFVPLVSQTHSCLVHRSGSWCFRWSFPQSHSHPGFKGAPSVLQHPAVFISASKGLLRVSWLHPLFYTQSGSVYPSHVLPDLFSCCLSLLRPILHTAGSRGDLPGCVLPSPEMLLLLCPTTGRGDLGFNHTQLLVFCKHAEYLWPVSFCLSQFFLVGTVFLLCMTSSGAAPMSLRKLCYSVLSVLRASQSTL